MFFVAAVAVAGAVVGGALAVDVLERDRRMNTPAAATATTINSATMRRTRRRRLAVRAELPMPAGEAGAGGAGRGVSTVALMTLAMLRWGPGERHAPRDRARRRHR